MGWGTGNIGGGSGGLNFKIVGGTAEPSNPKENMIWIITDQKITSYIFSAEEPESPVDGMVWITVGTSSTVEFNALKKNGIQVYPISAKQYVGGASVDVTAMSYQGGAWVDWLTYLYRPGMTVSLASMGWTPVSGQIAEAPKIEYNSDHIVVKLETSVGGRCGIGYFSNVDLTQFSNLHISLNLSGHIDSNYNVNCIRIWNNAGSEAARKILASGNAEIDIPVESLDGNYNIGIGLRRGNNNIYCKIFEAYLV